jgi:hypothetical protein
MLNMPYNTVIRQSKNIYVVHIKPRVAFRNT